MNSASLFIVSAFGFVAIYFSRQTIYWALMALFGMPSYAPQLFLQNPKHYQIVRIVLFFIFLCSLVALSPFRGFVDWVVVVMVWVAAERSGNYKALEKHATILRLGPFRE